MSAPGLLIGFRGASSANGRFAVQGAGHGVMGRDRCRRVADLWERFGETGTFSAKSMSRLWKNANGQR